MNNMKYLPNGQAVEVIQQLNDGWLVQDVVDVFESDLMTVDPIYVVKQVFDRAPTLKYDQQIQKLTDTIKSLQESRKKVEGLLRAEEKSREEKLEKFRKIDQLKLLEDFIDGKITHYVELSYSGPSIIKFEESKTDDRYDQRNTFKLLTLFGGAKGDLQWKLNRYSDGSGGYDNVFPCTSYDQAIEVAQKHIDSGNCSKSSNSVVKTAEKYGLTLPDGYLEKWKADKKANLVKAIEENEKTLRKNKASLLEIL